MADAKREARPAAGAGTDGRKAKAPAKAKAKATGQKGAKFAGLTGVPKAVASALTAKGLITVEAIANASAADIAGIDGADTVRQKAREAVMKAQSGGRRA